MSMKPTGMAKVVFLYGKKRQFIHETNNKSYAFCKWWIQQHKDDPQYQGGVLKAVSVYVRTHH